MSFSRVSLFGVLATLTNLGEARVNPTLGDESMTWIGFVNSDNTYQPNANYGVSFPARMSGFGAWRQGANPGPRTFPAGTDLTITCDSPNQDCEIFVSVHSCSTCDTSGTDGGLQGQLIADGWTSAPCAPMFNANGVSGFKMHTFRKQLNDEEVVTYTTTSPLSRLVISEQKTSVSCSTGFSNAVSCNAQASCNWNLRAGSCASAACPAPVGPSPPAPCTCAAIPPVAA